METGITTNSKEAGSPFGAMTPSPFQERVRRLAQRLPVAYAGRKLASLMLGLAGGRSGRAFDVSIFDTQKARLYPADNICEKRVFIAPQHWDMSERMALAAAITAHAEGPFYFMDIGANAGLYSLFARAAAMKARKQFRAICIEPDPEMRARAAFNITASGAEEEIRIMPYAAHAENRHLRFSVNQNSRGMSRIDESGDTNVEGRTLKSLIEESLFPRVDAMKIDIEGHEFSALNAFFQTAQSQFWPRFAILETSHERGAQSASSLFEDRGYQLSFTTQLNSVFVHP